MRTTTTAASWINAEAPGIQRTYPHPIMRAMRYACRHVDLDIERTGTVSVEAVESVREALAMMKAFDALDPMHPEAWTPDFLTNLPTAAH